MHTKQKSEFKYHYFYKIVKKDTGEYYYGIHSTNKPDDRYMGSGTRIRKLYRLFGKDSFEKIILKYLPDRASLLEYEKQVVNESVLRDHLCLNMIEGGVGSYQGYTTKGLVTVRDKNGNIFDVSTSDPRYLSGELKSISSNLVVVRDIHGQCLQVSVTDPRYISGELTIVSKGNKGFSGWTVVYKDGEYRNIKKIDLDEYKANGWVIRSKSKGRKSPTNGMIWVVRGEEQSIIKPEEFEKYKTEGWMRGRSVSPVKNKIGVSKDGVDKYIDKDELPDYIANGWTRKMKSRNKGKITITTDNGKTWVHVSKDDPILKTLNYKTVTQIKPTCKGKKYIHKENQVKRVKIEEISIYLDNGWKLGIK